MALAGQVPASWALGRCFSQAAGLDGSRSGYSMHGLGPRSCPARLSSMALMRGAVLLKAQLTFRPGGGERAWEEAPERGERDSARGEPATRSAKPADAHLSRRADDRMAHCRRCWPASSRLRVRLCCAQWHRNGFAQCGPTDAPARQTGGRRRRRNSEAIPLKVAESTNQADRRRHGTGPPPTTNLQASRAFRERCIAAGLLASEPSAATLVWVADVGARR